MMWQHLRCGLNAGQVTVGRGGLQGLIIIIYTLYIYIYKRKINAEEGGTRRGNTKQKRVAQEEQIQSRKRWYKKKKYKAEECVTRRGNTKQKSVSKEEEGGTRRENTEQKVVQGEKYKAEECVTRRGNTKQKSVSQEEEIQNRRGWHKKRTYKAEEGCIRRRTYKAMYLIRGPLSVCCYIVVCPWTSRSVLYILSHMTDTVGTHDLVTGGSAFTSRLDVERVSRIVAIRS